MARPPHKLKKEKLVEGVSGLRSLQDLGVKIHKLKHIKLHAKLILADDSHAIIGSINLAPGSFDSRRELAIQVDDPHIIHRIKKTLEDDWKARHSILRQGLLAELRTTTSVAGPCHFNKSITKTGSIHDEERHPKEEKTHKGS